MFAGRETNLAELLALLAPDGAADRQHRVGVVAGLPGVGKTELVVQAAHTALAAGWFPGGVLFIDVRGYDPKLAMTAEAALDDMLRMMGIAADDIPPGDYRLRLLTSVLAKYAADGKPILVVIDNVASSEIAAALVPAVGATLVTSRHALAELRAQRIDLGELGESAALKMLDGELRVSHATDARIIDQNEDALSIARLCGELPLALHIVAALLTEDTTRPLSSMAEDLRDVNTRLDEMRYREDTRGERGVRAAFDLSYQRLDAEQARILRLLPLNIGQEVSTEAVAAMAELDVRTARQRLEELRSAHLIRSGSTYGRHGRWQMHDLIRLYAIGLDSPPNDRSAGLLMLLGHYLENAQAAARLLDPGATRSADSPFADRWEALEWLDEEYPNLTPFSLLVPIEPKSGRMLTADLFLSLWRYFEIRRRTEDWVRFTTDALAVVCAFGDRVREGEALSKLSGAFRQARRFDEAIDAARDAIAIHRELGERHAEGVALNNLTGALLEVKRYDEAIITARDAVAVFQETDDRHREGLAFLGLGSALAGAGQHSEGVIAFERAAQLVHEFGDLRVEAGALTNLGLTLSHIGGELQEIIDLHRRAAEALTQAGDLHGKGAALINLAAALLDAGCFDEAAVAARDAATLMRDAEDPRGLGKALENLSTALREVGRTGEAAEALADAMTAYQRSGDQDAEVEARLDFGDALQEAGDREEAIKAFRSTADMCRKAANHQGESRALRSLGRALWQAKQREEAVATLRAAVSISHAAGDHQGEARALVYLGTVFIRGQIDDAIAVLRDAVELGRRVGDADLSKATSEALRNAERAKRARDKLNALLAAGRFEDVIADYQASSARLAAEQDVVDRGVTGDMATTVGTALSRAGRFDQAVTFLEEAVAAFHEADDPDQERTARTELDLARNAQIEAQTAAGALEHSLRVEGGDDRAMCRAITEAVRHLGPHDARFFRLLAANPGPDISLSAAAILAVADRVVTLTRLEDLSALVLERANGRLFRRVSELYRDDAKIARGALDVLTRMRLVEQAPADSKRWRLPAAIRRFAAEQLHKYAEQDLCGQVKTLLHIYYLAGAHDASAPLDAGVVAPALRESQARSLRWLEAEYPNLVATVRNAKDDDLGATIALDLTRSLTHIMGLGRKVDDAVELGLIARRAAQRLHDRHAEAVVLRNLGGSLLTAGRQNEAITAMRAALAIFQEVGDKHGEGTALTNLGSVLIYADQFAEAGTLLRAAIDIHHQSGRSFNEALALTSLGILLEKTDRLEEAITSYNSADRIYRKIGDQHSRAATLTQFADLLRRAGRDDEAIKAYQRAATLARLTSDGLLATFALRHLADLYGVLGRQAEADEVLHEIASVASATDNPTE